MEKTRESSPAPQKIERKVFTVQETAKMLAVAPITIRKAIKSGKIKAIQISAKGRYRIHSEEIDHFMQRKG